MKTYTFRVVVEPDEGGYHAYCPALRRYGAVTQGGTPEEALKNINEVVQMVVEELQEDGIPLPLASGDDVEVFDGTRVAVTVLLAVMAIDSRIRGLTAEEIIRALLADGLFYGKAEGAIADTFIRTVAASPWPFGSNTTFVPKTLRSMIEEQAGWTNEDLKRLKLIRH